MKPFAVLFITVFQLAAVLAQTGIKRIRPSDTDPQISTFNEDSNYVYLNPSVAAKNILLVHLPGSFGEPKRATLFGSLAADLGFHSIGLMYPNAPTVGSFCTNSNDPDCFENVRREIVDGVDYSPELVIHPSESILNRVQKLLIYLRSNFPTENWGQYLDASDRINFRKIIFSGHSQGGGHAAIIAKYYGIRRAVCLSSPKDWRNNTDAPPLWLSTGEWLTPKSEIYSFNHTLDEHTNHQLEIWDSLGLDNYGPPVNVDTVASPYRFTRQLTTSFLVPIGDDHGCTVQDNKTPKRSGSPVFIPVWTYMLTDQLTAGGLSEYAGDGGHSLPILPNPASNFIRVELPTERCTLQIFDHAGKLVYENQQASGTLQVDVSRLGQGVYVAKAFSDRATWVGKWLKQ